MRSCSPKTAVAIAIAVVFLATPISRANAATSDWLHWWPFKALFGSPTERPFVGAQQESSPAGPAENSVQPPAPAGGQPRTQQFPSQPPFQPPLPEKPEMRQLMQPPMAPPMMPTMPFEQRQPMMGPQGPERMPQPFKGQQPPKGEQQRFERQPNEPTDRGQDDFEQEEQRPMINPQQIRETLRQINDQTRELKRLQTRAKRTPGAQSLMGEISGLVAKLSEFKQKMRSSDPDELEEAMESFHDSQIWEAIGSLRIKIELPKQLARMEKELTRAEKLLKQKVFQTLTTIGVNFDRINEDLAGMRGRLSSIKNLLGSGSVEDIQDAMQDLFEGGHPGEIQGALQRMRELSNGLRRVRNAEIRKELLEIVQPVIDAFNDGDYKEANELLNELSPEMRKLLSRLSGTRRILDAQTRAKLDAVNQRIQQKFPQAGSNPEVEEFEREVAP